MTVLGVGMTALARELRSWVGLRQSSLKCWIKGAAAFDIFL
jgi:hypothetical protein